MADLGPYPTHVQGIADELTQYLHGGVLGEAYRFLDEQGKEGLLRMDETEQDKALRLLSQTPSQRDKTLSRLDDKAAAVLLMRARYMGLASAKVLRFSERFTYVRGMSYRNAARLGAEEALSFSPEPAMSDIAPGWYGPGDHDGYDQDENARPRFW